MLGLITGLIWLLIRIVLGLLFYATPLVGFWVASSLAAYLGGPQWMPWAAGALLFPVIPGFWEFISSSRPRAKNAKAYLTTVDRLSLRTFAVGLAFLIVLLCIYPQTAFVALSTRGDWMLDGVKDPRAENARRILFASAGGLEWLYRLSKTNPYKAQIDRAAREREEAAKRQLQQDLAKQLAKQESVHQTGESEQDLAKQLEEQQAVHQREKDVSQHYPPETEQDLAKQLVQQQAFEKGPELRSALVQWPWKDAALHPAVATMPASVETSIKSVARYIADKEHDPVLRIKALHDYVADRLAYDYESFYAGRYPPQDAQTVFETRKCVCAGYANLLSALADAINEKIIVVVGYARPSTDGEKLTGHGHAWNAARIRGHWYLIDSCWDSGSISRETGFTKRYRTDYLLQPPEVMIEDHYPEDQTWQLLAHPLSEGDFLRQPMLRPGFEAADLKLVAPTRARNDADSTAVVIVKNPKKAWLMADVEQNGQQVGSNSMAVSSETAQLECPLPNRGVYRMNMFMNPESEYGHYEYIGSVDFVRQ